MGGCDQSALLARTLGEPGYRYLALSRPGYLGTPLRSGQTPQAQADLCAALLDELGIAHAAVMAVSGGGPCAIHFALRHPDRCRALVLVSTVAGRIANDVPVAFKLMTRLARKPWFVAWLKKRVARNPERVAARSIADPEILARTLADDEAWPLFRDLLLSTYDQMGQRLEGTFNDIAITSTTSYPLERIGVPTLAVHGTADKMVPYEANAKAFEARIPNARLLTVDGGEHVAIFSHRALVRPQVVAFLRKHA
jgi:pimeloyl-ACP methyl ester carboxylesterase